MNRPRTAMLDEASITTILARHFPTAARSEIDHAARDVVLLELLADDRLVVWEDSMNDPQDQSMVQMFAAPRRES